MNRPKASGRDSGKNSRPIRSRTLSNSAFVSTVFRPAAIRLFFGLVGAVALIGTYWHLWAGSILLSSVGALVVVYKWALWLESHRESEPSSKKKSIAEARSTLRDSNKRLVDFTSFRAPRKDTDFAPTFAEIFCGMLGYQTPAAEQRFPNLLRSLAHARKRKPVLLLGAPGSGKSITLQAFFLSCANSFLFRERLPQVILGKDASLQIVTKIGNAAARARSHAFETYRTSSPGSPREIKRRDTRAPKKSFFRKRKRRISGHLKNKWSRFINAATRFTLDETWLSPAPPCFPILVPLRQYEAEIRQSSETDARSPAIAFNFLEQVVSRQSSLAPEDLWWLFRRGRLCLLFDGLDEIRSSERKNFLDLLAKIDQRPDAAPGNQILVTCRTATFRDDLRDHLSLKFSSFLEVAIKPLSNAGAREIVARLISAEIGRPPKERSGLLSNFETDKALPGGARARRRLHAEKALVIENLTDSITRLLPRKYIKWRPDRNPLSLRRVTLFFLARSPRLLRKEYDDHHRAERWGLAESEALKDYAEIVLGDVREYIRRRPLCLEIFEAKIPDLLFWYGRFAFSRLERKSISEDDLAAFLEPKVKVAGGEALEAFLLPGILTDGGENCYIFRDLETQHVLASFYVCYGRNQSDKINELIATFSQPENKESAAIVLSMVFDRIPQDLLSEIVPAMKSFSQPEILETLLSQRLRDVEYGQLSKTEAEPLLRRCLGELQKRLNPSSSLRVWETVRLIVFSRSRFDWSLEALASLVNDRALPPDVRAQALLIMAEDIYFYEPRGVSDDLFQSLIDDDSALVGACAVAALRLLSPGRLSFNAELASLCVALPDGRYKVGDTRLSQNPEWRIDISNLKIGRFPVLRFEYERWLGTEGKMTPGRAFEPAVGMTLGQAREYAKSQGGSLPNAAELEVAASYEGAEKQPRLYPWGNSFSKTTRDLVTARVAGLRLPSRPRPILLATALGTPSGLTDFTANIRQMSDDEIKAKARVGRDTVEKMKIITIGLPVLEAAFPQNYRCIERGEVLSEVGHPDVGFRLAWR